MVSVDELIKKLKKKLRDPKPYSIEYTYHYLGKECFHSGKLWIDEEKNNKRQIVGEIYDPDSKRPKHALEGEIFLQSKLVRMNFVKISPGVFEPIYYSLVKYNYLSNLSDENIIGYYIGICSSKEETISLKNLSIVYTPKGCVSVRLKSELSNRVELKLYK